MLTSIEVPLFYTLISLFNFIFSWRLYPTQWLNCIVIAIYKNKGSTVEPKNYRPISIVNLLSKVLDFILLDRFKNWFHPSVWE